MNNSKIITALILVSLLLVDFKSEVFADLRPDFIKDFNRQFLSEEPFRLQDNEVLLSEINVKSLSKEERVLIRKKLKAFLISSQPGGQFIHRSLASGSYITGVFDEVTVLRLKAIDLLGLVGDKEDIDFFKSLKTGRSYLDERCKRAVEHILHPGICLDYEDCNRESNYCYHGECIDWEKVKKLIKEENWPVETCAEIQFLPYASCIVYVVANRKDPQLCEKIRSNANSTTEDFFAYINCLETAARETKDLSICAQINEILLKDNSLIQNISADDKLKEKIIERHELCIGSVTGILKGVSACEDLKGVARDMCFAEVEDPQRQLCLETGGKYFSLKDCPECPKDAVCEACFVGCQCEQNFIWDEVKGCVQMGPKNEK